MKVGLVECVRVWYARTCYICTMSVLRSSSCTLDVWEGAYEYVEEFAFGASLVWYNTVLQIFGTCTVLTCIM